MEEKLKEKYMRLAIKEALKAYAEDEVPIGAIIIMNGKVIARAHNLVEKKNLPTAHAEILAIEKACKKIGGWRLDGAELFVTVEPCPMCAGATANARIKKVYFGAFEPKSGSAVSKFRVLSEGGLNHTVDFESGVLGAECADLLKNYFKAVRKAKKP